MNARKILPTVGMLAASLVVFSACSTGASEDPTEAAETTAAEEGMTSDGGGMASDGGGMASDGGGMDDPAANLIGAGCADYAEAVPDGPGSVAGMAEDPVSVAASNNPLLTTLVKAVAGELNPDVNLVDTLDGGEFTVFAPVDDAFAAIPEEDLNALASDSDALSGVLTYHVVPGQITPDELADTTQTTVQGEEVEVTGSGDEMMVNGATVICGGVQTQNATVYLVDTVLMPPSMTEQG